jgi:hypothetical protein
LALNIVLNDVVLWSYNEAIAQIVNAHFAVGLQRNGVSTLHGMRLAKAK